ncbi:hypothetical protein H8E77_08415 [bacterium]|nr:hypothetical protein [bacterium]
MCKLAQFFETLCRDAALGIPDYAVDSTRDGRGKWEFSDRATGRLPTSPAKRLKIL